MKKIGSSGNRLENHKQVRANSKICDLDERFFACDYELYASFLWCVCDPELRLEEMMVVVFCVLR